MLFPTKLRRTRVRKKLLILFPLTLLVSNIVFAQPKGYLFAIGGGNRSAGMMKKFIELAERFNSGKIVVFPMASSVPLEVGPEQAEELRNLGAKEVEYHILTREQALDEKNTGILENLGGIFFSGGVQSRLADVLIDTPFLKRIKKLYEEGCVIGGTSAGAAVLSEIMITGDEKREVESGYEFQTLEADNIVTEAGFAFIRSAIIDQHFVRRKRHNRLLSLVSENPDTLGIGIDESTAIIVGPDESFKVFGERSVIVYDMSQAEVKIRPDRTFRSHGIFMHILKSGDRYDLKRKIVFKDKK